MSKLIVNLAAAATVAMFLSTQQGFSQDLENRSLGNAYAHMVSFEAEPEVSSAWFTVDNNDDEASDADLSTTKLPLYKEFESDQHEWSWFAQAAFSYMSFEESLYFARPDGGRESVTPKWEAYGGLLESGVILPVGKGFSFAPSLSLGVSRLENEMKFSNPLLEEGLPPGYKGAIYDWDTLTSVVRAHGAMRYEGDHGPFLIKGAAHLSFSYLDSFDESTGFAGFHDHASTLVLKLDAKYPLDATIRDYPLSVIGHLGHTSFMGPGRDELGFSYFSEVGASIGVGSGAVGLLGVLGDNVEGWSLTFNYGY